MSADGHGGTNRGRRQGPTGHQAGATSTARRTDGQNRPAEPSSRRRQGPTELEAGTPSRAHGADSEQTGQPPRAHQATRPTHTPNEKPTTPTRQHPPKQHDRSHTHRRPDTTTAANNPTKTTPTHRQRSATNGHPTAGPLGGNIREHGQVRGTGGGQRTAHGLVNDGHATDRRLTETREATRAGPRPRA